MKIVYDALNSLDAYVVRNLLENEGIEAFVQGEHLQGGVGELSAMNLVKVAVNDIDAKRAREIIKEWETKEITADPRFVISREKFNHRSSIFFALIFGCVAGAFATYISLRTPETHDGLDFNRDGQNDEIYTYRNGRISKFEADTNLDGRVDYIVEYDGNGLAEVGRYDLNFNDEFETRILFERNLHDFIQMDLDEDGEVDVVEEYENGELFNKTFFDSTTGLSRKKLYYKQNRLVSADLDTNGDGALDLKVTYDSYEEEISRAPIPK